MRTEMVRVENETEVGEPNAQGTVDRLMMSNMEKNNRLAQLRRKVIFL
jgi:hypothetical protein